MEPLDHTGAPSYCIRSGYAARATPTYFEDDVDAGVVHQPDVYALAAILAKAHGCGQIVDFGCGRAGKLMQLAEDYSVVGVDFGENISFCRSAYPGGRWVEADLENASDVTALGLELDGSLVICADVIEHLAKPDSLLDLLGQAAQTAAAVLVSTPERDLVRGEGDTGPPANPAHVREWTLEEFRALLEDAGLPVAFSGLTVNNTVDLQKRSILAVLDRRCVARTRPPADVLAVVTCFNEVDVVRETVLDLLGQGVRVHVIDNWSTDGSWELLAGGGLSDGLTGLERFPPHGASDTYEWRNLLRRVEEITSSVVADWYVHHDADERRRSPWHAVSLPIALALVGDAGFNAVDHTRIDFRPIDDSFTGRQDLERHFRFFEFNTSPNPHVKAWKRTDNPVSLASSGGHDATFGTRRVFPYNFLLKHYPIRSQLHGLTKVHQRVSRWSAEERALGWHVQYDQVDEQHVFIRAPWRLREYDARFDDEFLVERLSRIGVDRSVR